MRVQVGKSVNLTFVENQFYNFLKKMIFGSILTDDMLMRYFYKTKHSYMGSINIYTCLFTHSQYIYTSAHCIYTTPHTYTPTQAKCISHIVILISLMGFNGI